MKELGKLKKDFGIGPMSVPCQCYCSCSCGISGDNVEAARDKGSNSGSKDATLHES